MCLQAVTQNGLAVAHVPSRFRTHELNQIAYRHEDLNEWSEEQDSTIVCPTIIVDVPIGVFAKVKNKLICLFNKS